MKNNEGICWLEACWQILSSVQKIDVTNFGKKDIVITWSSQDVDLIKFQLLKGDQSVSICGQTVFRLQSHEGSFLLSANYRNIRPTGEICTGHPGSQADHFSDKFPRGGYFLSGLYGEAPLFQYVRGSPNYILNWKRAAKCLSAKNVFQHFGRNRNDQSTKVLGPSSD